MKYPYKLDSIIKNQIPNSILEAMNEKGWNCFGIYELINKELKIFLEPLLIDYLDLKYYNLNFTKENIRFFEYIPSKYVDGRKDYNAWGEVVVYWEFSHGDGFDYIELEKLMDEKL